MNRKQRRAMEKKVGKENSQNLAEKIFQFEQLPDECLACLKPFDKANRQMVTTWNVVVRDKDTVRLYCPDCWQMATKTYERYCDEQGEKDAKH
jgi:hypothetical protein